jgi:hypothetical protein
MGALPSENRKYQVQQLNDLHRECIRLTLLGWKTKQIADFLGVTEPTVCNAVNGAKGRTQLAIMRGARDAETVDLAKDIVEFAAKAWDIAKELIEDANVPTALRLKYCFETIGIAGHVKPQRVQMSGAVAHLTVDEIGAIKERAKLLALESGVLDAEFCEQGELSCEVGVRPGEDTLENAGHGSSDMQGGSGTDTR